MNERLKLAEHQRFAALKNALETVDEFAIPSTDPETYTRWDDMRNYLLKLYKPTDESPSLLTQP